MINSFIDKEVLRKIITIQRFYKKRLNIKSLSGYIYVIKEREFVKTNENIYKSGKTKRTINERLCQYPKNSILLFTMFVHNCHETEQKIIKELKNKFIQRKDIGTEYFQGDINKIIKEVFDICNLCNIKIISSSFNNKIEDKDDKNKILQQEVKKLELENKLKKLNLMKDEEEKLNILLEFINDSCKLDIHNKEYKIFASNLFQEYKRWCFETKNKQLMKKDFDKGIDKITKYNNTEIIIGNNNSNGWYGIKIIKIYTKPIDIFIRDFMEYTKIKKDSLKLSNILNKYILENNIFPTPKERGEIKKIFIEKLGRPINRNNVLMYDEWLLK